MLSFIYIQVDLRYGVHHSRRSKDNNKGGDHRHRGGVYEHVGVLGKGKTQEVNPIPKIIKANLNTNRFWH